MRSVNKEVALGDVRTFSSFSDFLKEFIDLGYVQSLEDLLENRQDLLGTSLFKWFGQGQIACVFAQNLSRRPSTAEWESITIQGEINAELLEPLFEEAAEKLEALQIIFPGSGTAQQAIEIIQQLCKHPSWICKRIDWLPGEEGDSLQIGLRWQPATGKYMSWVLGIAPFDGMPFTRQFVEAPFIALVFRPSPPTEFAAIPKDENGIPASHLAHMNDGLGDNVERRNQFDKATRRAKAALLGSELRSKARAKVTFSFPPEYEQYLANILENQEESNSSGSEM